MKIGSHQMIDDGSVHEFPGMLLQMPDDRIVHDVRVLILSLHGATAKDTAMHIHSAGVRQENIVCVVWMWYTFLVNSWPCVRDAKLEAFLIPFVQDVTGFSQEFVEIAANDSWVERFAHGTADALARFDVLWADFPATFDLLFDRVASHKFIMRATQRFDHHTVRLLVNSTDDTHHNLLRVIRTAPVVFAGSENNWWYINYIWSSQSRSAALYFKKPFAGYFKEVHESGKQARMRERGIERACDDSNVSSISSDMGAGRWQLAW